MPMSLRYQQCVLTTIVVAFCSMVYELLLAQTMATLFGNSVTSYSLTIGLYICALGFGSLLAPADQMRDARDSLCKLELWLTGVGVSAPIVMGYFHGKAMALGLDLNISLVICCALIVLIGLMSGAELPLLMLWAKQQTGRDQIGLQILGWDYVGCFLATIAFPLLLYPNLGLLHVACGVAALNLFAALGLVTTAGHRPQRRLIVALGLAGLLLTLAWQEPAARDLILSATAVTEAY